MADTGPPRPLSTSNSWKGMGRGVGQKLPEGRGFHGHVESSNPLFIVLSKLEGGGVDPRQLGENSAEFEHTLVIGFALDGSVAGKDCEERLPRTIGLVRIVCKLQRAQLVGANDRPLALGVLPS